MSGNSSHFYECLSSDQIALVNQFCDQFEQAWREGNTPDVAEHLSSAPESIRKVLLHELVLVDATYRKQAGVTFDIADCYKHLPGLDQHWLDENIPSVESDNRTAVTAEALPGLSRYDVLAETGRGGMGVVYRARDRRLGRTVCLKALHEDACRRPDRLARFRREARVVSSLNHPNICTLYELEEHQGRPYLVLEWIEGETFRAINREELDLSRLIHLVGQTAQALDAAHTAGVIHRDIKPENLIVRPDGIVKVLDFGLARLHESDLSLASEVDESTAAGVLLGTASYMSPEQARGEPTTASSDIFSLGTVFFELLVGSNPFRGRSAVESMHRVCQADLPIITNYTDSLPVELVELVSAMHCQRPDQRPTAGDVSELLNRWIVGGGVELSSGMKLPFANPIHEQRAVETQSQGESSTNLPLCGRRLTGRDTELAELAAQLAHRRVVTVLGAGGVGKTSLAYEAARQSRRRFPGGVWLCELAPLRDPSRMIETLAGVLDSNAGTANTLEEVTARLTGEPVLLVLDNCEHVIDAAAELVERLTQQAPNLTILTTSRQTLQIADETVIRLDGLEQSDAATLFVTQAAAQGGLDEDSQSDDLVKQIVKQLEGLPLAIELAAPKLASMTLTELLEALDNQSLTLRSGRRSSDRQSTIDQTISWSFDLLEPPEKQTLLAVSVFTAWFTSESAVEVSGLGPEAKAHLSRLVEQSVVSRKEHRGRSRYRLLEPIRQYCQKQIDRNMLEAARERHARYFAQRAITKLSLGISGYDELECLHAINAEWFDLREAIAWGREHLVPEVAIDPCVAMARTAFLQMRLEVFDWLIAAEDSMADTIASDADALATIAWGNWHQNRYDDSRSYLSRSRKNAPTLFSLWTSAYLPLYFGDYEQSVENWRTYRLAAEQAGEQSELRWARSAIEAVAIVYQDKVSPHVDELVDIAERQLAELDWPTGTAIHLASRTVIELHRGNASEARRIANHTMEAARRAGASFYELGIAALYAGMSLTPDAGDTLASLRSTLDAYRSLLKANNPALLPMATRGLVAALATHGAAEAATRASAVAERFRVVGGRRAFTTTYSEIVDELRERLGNEKFEQLREEGQRLTVDDLLIVGTRLVEEQASRTEKSP